MFEPLGMMFATLLGMVVILGVIWLFESVKELKHQHKACYECVELIIKRIENLERKT